MNKKRHRSYDIYAGLGMLACKLSVEDNFLDNIAKNSTTGHFDNIAIAEGKSKHTWAIPTAQTILEMH